MLNLSRKHLWLVMRRLARSKVLFELKDQRIMDVLRQGPSLLLGRMFAFNFVICHGSKIQCIVRKIVIQPFQFDSDFCLQINVSPSSVCIEVLCHNVDPLSVDVCSICTIVN